MTKLLNTKPLRVSSNYSSVADYNILIYLRKLVCVDVHKLEQNGYRYVGSKLVTYIQASVCRYIVLGIETN